MVIPCDSDPTISVAYFSSSRTCFPCLLQSLKLMLSNFLSRFGFFMPNGAIFGEV